VNCGADLSAGSSSSSDAFVNRLKTDVPEWESEGLLNHDQAKRLLARYGLIPNETSDTLHRSKFASILAVLGVVLVGIGVILVMGSNWQSIPKWFRLLLLMGCTAASYVGGYRLAYESRSYRKIGTALLLLGSLLWGTSILLIGQMFSSGGEGGERAALLYWLAGVLPLAYVLRSPLHMGLSLLIWSVWFVWGLIHPMHYSFGPGIASGLLAMGILISALGVLHSLWSPTRALSNPFRSIGFLQIFLALYASSFKDFWWDRGEFSGLFLALPVAAAVLVSAAALAFAVRLRDKAGVREAVGLLVLLCISAVVVIPVMLGWASAHHRYGTYGYDPPHSLIAALVFNLILLASELGVIALGWYRNRPGLINVGLTVFVIQVVTRYFDTLSGMLQGGLVFIIAGLMLIPAAIAIERTRRRLLASAAARGSV
jgi:uncharacterized membrane protein